MPCRGEKECVTCSSGASAREETLQSVQQAPCSRSCAWGLKGKQRELRGCLGMRGEKRQLRSGPGSDFRE